MDKSNLVLTLEQRQALSIQQVESLELLGYSNQELESFLTTEYLENPMLESSDDKQSTQIQNIEQMYEKSTSYGEHYKKWADETNRRDVLREFKNIGTGRYLCKRYCGVFKAAA